MSQSDYEAGLATAARIVHELMKIKAPMYEALYHIKAANITHPYQVTPLESAVRKLTPVFLDMAGDALGSSGCNDFSLKDLTREEQEAIVTYQETRNGTPEDIQLSVARLPNTTDFCMAYACEMWHKENA